jgi:methionyl-tRNA formyltransferase
MRLVFCGTPDDAVPSLEALHAAGHELALVVTQPDRRRGRSSATTPSPVRAAAERLGLDIRTPERAREVVDDVRASGADLGIVVAFGQLLPVALLEALPHGFVNVHYSLLPRWRGAAPVERAILAGDATTGVCIMALEEGLDTGPVYACEETEIGPHETAGELRERLNVIGSELLVRTLPDVPSREPEPQRGEPTYADKLTVEEFRLDPRAQDAHMLDRLVRAGNPRPGAWCTIDGRRLKVLRARPDTVAERDAPGTIDVDARLTTARGALTLLEVQPEGRRAMSAIDWRRGVPAPTLRVDAE